MKAKLRFLSRRYFVWLGVGNEMITLSRASMVGLCSVSDSRRAGLTYRLSQR